MTCYRTAPLLLSALLFFGVGCAKPQAANPAAMDDLAAHGDTTGLAHLAEQECQSKATTARTSCYEDYFVKLARSDRVRVALGALTVLAAAHPEVQAEGHNFTHVIGIRAWKDGEDVRTVFRGCTGIFQSGCYHGVIQGYLLSNGQLDSVRAVTLCDQVAPDESDRWLRFQCVHGLGHGFEMAWNWELPRALQGCDWLKDDWDRSSCYGGAFMENAIASMPGGHHMTMAVHALAATDSDMGKMADMPGMDHGHGPDPSHITYKMRDSSDALYPCSAVGKKYEFACYQLQGGLILNRVDGDFARATSECDKADPLGRQQCYVSLGTNASGYTLQNVPKTIADCSHGNPQMQPYCFSGAVKNYIDITSHPADGIKLCDAIQVGDNRAACFTAVGEEISVLFPTDAAARSNSCSKLSPDDARECRRGADVSTP
ncbi:MAG TPA: hypothetical protein VGM77_05890 [Gemmatimonadales bacterium]|jgi:hypothetical protein